MITVTDLFCGAGGSGLGAHAVPGVQLRIAANHWALAVDTHAENFPDTDHDCADISQANPRRYPRTDILWASPECTNHSQAKGSRRPDAQPDLFGDTLPDEAAERSRATMWDVPRFAEHHRYRAVIVENVVDAARWVMWPAWLQAMSLLGYQHRIVFLNSMHAPGIAAPRAPQSRDRLYVVFWRDGDRAPNVDIRPAAWCEQCQCDVAAIQSWKRPDRDPWGRYRAQYIYRCPNAARRHSIVEPYADPAAVAIDWSLPGQRIGDRTKPLSEKTLARIRAGRAAHPRLLRRRDPSRCRRSRRPTRRGATRRRVRHQGDAMTLIRHRPATTGELVALYAHLADAQARWQEQAACAEVDPEIFFPEKGGSSREAKRICGRCEVRAECLEHALTRDERFGILGGLSERERRRLKRAPGGEAA